MDEQQTTLDGFTEAAESPKRARKPKAPAAHSSSSGDSTQIISYRHPDRRKNNPEVGVVNEATDPAQPQTVWSYDPHIDPALQFDSARSTIETLIDNALASGDQDAMRLALEELKRLQSPYLNWTGKAERTSFEIDTVSLHVHERIDPMSILAAVRKEMNPLSQGGRGQGRGGESKAIQPGLFEAPFESLPLRDAIDFYHHDRGWANRLVAGDSLLVMNSLLQKESMAGQVQMIYLDPPYGIKYGSNFQPFVGKRDVKDRSDADLTQEPEMIKAFRDTWELGIHSYLTYLRDRLLLAKDLLSETGSVFVQISDENLHLVRNLMDDVFGVENFVGLIQFKKTGGFETGSLPSICDYIVWYSKCRGCLKYRQLYDEKNYGEGSGKRYKSVLLPTGKVVSSSKFEDATGQFQLPIGARLFLGGPLTSDGAASDPFSLDFEGRKLYHKTNQHWKTTKEGLQCLARAGKLFSTSSFVNYRLFLDDFPATPLTNMWTDTMGTAERDKSYVVQTTEKIIERCLLMTTDPGDLVLDPTCGSGTTAYVAEK
ncbi:MAG: site-specific DNA-methyltransferase, partial [Geobacteraceae bacterium]